MKTPAKYAATTVDYKTALEVATHEAVVRQAYKNSGDVWTWSIGLTSATGHKVERYIGKPQSLDHCLRVYAWALDNYADEVRYVFRDVVLTHEQFTAALSFHWNTGKIKTATWVKKWKAGDIAGARRGFLAYNKPASIKERRKAEHDLFFDGKWSQTGLIGEYTKLTPSGAIVWSSRRNINIEAELRAAMSGVTPASDKVITEVEKNVPVAPPQIDKPVTQTTGFWERITQLLGLTGIGGVAAFFQDWRVVVALAGALFVVAIVGLVLHKRIIDAVRTIKQEVGR